MTYRIFALVPLLAVTALQAQPSLPIPLGPVPLLLPPAVDNAGARTVFATTITPEGKYSLALNLYSALTNGSAVTRLKDFAGDSVLAGANAVSITPDAGLVAYTAGEEVHLFSTAGGDDHLLAVNKQNCVRPLAICPACLFTCVGSPHVSLDGSQVLYAVKTNSPFWVINADGTGLRNLNVYSGTLASSPQRVLSRNGILVFTSTAPAGPTFAASAENVYLTGLGDGAIKPLTQFGLNPSVYTREASISADGALVVFESNYDPTAAGKLGQGQIWAVRADASAPIQLTSGPEPATQPSLSADGKLAAFVRAGQVWVVGTAGGTEPRKLTSFKYSTARDAVLSGDGSRVVFALGPENGSNAALYVVNSDGTGLRSIYAPPAIASDGIRGAAANTAPAAGSLISIYGTNLAADDLVAASAFPLPRTLGGVSLLVNGQPVPLLAVTPWQVNAQLPPDLAAGKADFQLRVAGGQSTSVSADVALAAPAVFTYVGPTGETRAAALHGGTGSLIDDAHPAKAGEILEIYGTGLGPTAPAVAAGEPASAKVLSWVMEPPRVLIGGLAARVVFAGLAPGFAGVYQVNAVVPEGLSRGQYAITWLVGATASTGPGVLSVR